MPHDLDQTSLHALLDALGGNPAESGLAYENLRIRLIRFFSWNHCHTPEELADTALDRLAGKLAFGGEPILDPQRFAAGIARMLLHEYRAQQEREQKMLTRFLPVLTNRQPRPETEQEQEDALNHCLEWVTAEDRQLLERYYTGDASERIRNRQSLAKELGIGLNALRNRALRLRRQLEECTSSYRRRRGSRRDESPGVITHNEGKTL